MTGVEEDGKGVEDKMMEGGEEEEVGQGWVFQSGW